MRACDDTYFQSLAEAVEHAVTVDGVVYCDPVVGEWYVRVYEEIDRT